MAYESKWDKYELFDRATMRELYQNNANAQRLKEKINVQREELQSITGWTEEQYFKVIEEMWKGFVGNWEGAELLPMAETRRNIFLLNAILLKAYKEY